MIGHIIYSILSVGICLLTGKAIEIFLPILPASLYGMMMFTALLHYRLLNAKRIQPCIEWALANMAVCFVPAGVGIINHFELIKNHGFALVAIIFLTTFLLLTFVGLSYQRQLNKQASVDDEGLSK
ncbi:MULTISPECIES: CidA/LrgA family protein [unclassified Colwellia]|uniref:CidA/LrgA family protein n=1 Tax=unclassified Colwellia TaxID=196834 RepID=UPI0015F6909E|nr:MULTISPECIES: CidA/LrgA family protein [unclassified Colwellia]MBA6230641.1 CidA/LrgA family protein [Colwellia sp. MB02u-7]MBA6234572.1 CidA/LrgA family protein [Colwellia sp. MB02u-11]MBA6255436.1 CidA/LrgA family protein [Colwellia sp. MB3u-28]MBA6261576.1 CidA/LrgA family protein [Colwellia sp. MB3u-41]MBA6301126.1 CidA/LrgA family protein [Colwellia sp. MB3u-22]